MSKITNIPEKIYLQIGNDCPEDEDFNDLSEVSWCKDKIYDNDIEYRLQSDIKGEVSADDKDILGLGNPFPLKDVLQNLVNASEYLLNNKSYDRHDYEEIGICVKRAKEIIQKLEYASIVNKESVGNDAILKELNWLHKIFSEANEYGAANVILGRIREYESQPKK
jgi:hypothetical protein